MTITSPFIHRFTIFSNAQPSVLHFDFAKNAKEVELVAWVFNGDASIRELKYTQVMTPALRERIPQLGVIGDKAYNIIKFFEEIPDGQKFFVIPEHIEDEIASHMYRSLLAHLNGIALDESDMDRICAYLVDHYEVYTFRGEDRRRIGEVEKDKRVCRFCGKRMPEAKFKNKSHAISESLGNKGLVCLEECDDCNRRLNETIEQDLTHMMAPHLLMHSVSGKNGIPEIKGDGFSMKIDTSSRDTLGRDTLVYTLRDMPNSRDPQEVFAGINKDYPLFLQYTPQNIYKCFCKFALSLIDSSELKYFQDTIAWINEPLTKHRLPPIWHYSVDTEGKTWEQTTTMIIMRRKNAHKELPYCWAIIIIAGDPYLFIIPFCSKDKYKFVGKSRQEFFINGIKKMMPTIQFHQRDMSGITPVKMKLGISFEISPECKEGVDYHIIAPQNKE